MVGVLGAIFGMGIAFNMWRLVYAATRRPLIF